MLRIEKYRKQLVSLSVLDIGALTERYDLGELICNSADEFFSEIGQHLFVIGKNIQLSETVEITVDLLAVDMKGQAVSIIPQKNKEQPQVSRAITCSGILAQWRPADLLDRLSEERRKALETFLDVSTGEINRQQGVILVAEDYDYEDLAATKWLRERHGMEIRCIRASMATDTQGNEYLSCTDLSDWSLPIYRMLTFQEDEQTKAEARVGGRRTQSRSGKYQAEHLKIGTGDQFVEGKLLDMSDGGLGVETTVALDLNSDVTVSGELFGEGSNLQIQGCARVAHCVSVDGNVFKIGLSFQEVKYRRLDSADDHKITAISAQ